MTRLTEHFSVEEMTKSATAIRKGLDNTCPPELIPNMLKVAIALEQLRAHFTLVKGRNMPLTVMSCYRSPAVNKAVGGSKTSAHMRASAADCMMQGVDVLELCQKAAGLILDYDQIIYEFGEWLHIGFAEKPRRQILTAVKRNGKTVYLPGFQP